MMELINFKASLIAPSPLDTKYWIDLTEDPTGGVIKRYKDNMWKSIIPELNSVEPTNIPHAEENVYGTVMKASLISNKLTSTATTALIVKFINDLIAELENAEILSVIPDPIG